MNQISPEDIIKIEHSDNNLTKSEKWLIDTFDQTNLADMAYFNMSNSITGLLIFNLLLFLIELVLINYHNITYEGQIIILAISTIVYFIICIFHVLAVKKLNNNKYNLIKSIAPEAIFELIFLCIGWVGLGLKSPLAIFRCFRYIRYLWYSKYFTTNTNSGFIYFFVIFYSHLLLQYVEKVRQELFTMKYTKGALTVFCLYFFTAYIFAVVYWQITRDLNLISPEGGASGNISQCNTLSHCFFIMIKFPFMDGNACDYWKSLLFHHSVMANYLGVLLGLYFYFTAIILINGLLGIFAGSAFSAVVQEQVLFSNDQLLDKINTLIKKTEIT